MRISEFWTLMEQEFGSGYGRYLADVHVLAALDGRTPSEAIEHGTTVRQVWTAICEDMEVPEERRFLQHPRRR